MEDPDALDETATQESPACPSRVNPDSMASTDPRVTRVLSAGAARRESPAAVPPTH